MSPKHHDRDPEEDDRDDVEELDIHSKHPASMINKTLLGLLCGSLGFGLSQLTIIGEVRVHGVELATLKQSMMEERKRTDDRIFEMVDQMKAQIAVNTAILQSNQQLVMQNDRFISLITTHFGMQPPKTP